MICVAFAVFLFLKNILSITKKASYIAIFLFLLLDLAYTFYQHQTKALDGDLVPVVLPSEHYQSVMDDPFGWKVLSKDSVYAATNRFFVHTYIYNLFRTAPGFLQKWMHPVDSVYATAAISKTLAHALLIGILAMFIIGTNQFYSRQFLVAAAILTPLFQSGGHFYKYIGIVDQSITYSCFYALPIALLLIFLKPFFERLKNNAASLSTGQFLIMILLLIILPFSGPLIPGIVLVMAALLAGDFFIKFLKKEKGSLYSKLSRSLQGLFIALTCLSLYSIFIGQNNLESQGHASVSLLERYSRLPYGVYYMLTQKLGYPLLLIMIGINIYILKKNALADKHLFVILRWIGLFTLLYLLLLPMGGFREYRPYILRKDTFLPVALLLIFFFSWSAFWILRQLQFKYKRYYIAVLLLFLAIFTITDKPDTAQYHCQRNLLMQLSESKEQEVPLPADCTILSWELIHTPEASKEQSQLLEFWKITSEEKRFYQKKE